MNFSRSSTIRVYFDIYQTWGVELVPSPLQIFFKIYTTMWWERRAQSIQNHPTGLRHTNHTGENYVTIPLEQRGIASHYGSFQQRHRQQSVFQSSRNELPPVVFTRKTASQAIGGMMSPKNYGKSGCAWARPSSACQAGKSHGIWERRIFKLAKRKATLLVAKA